MAQQNITKRQAQKLRTRELIEETALSVFADKGFAAARAVDIANAAGVSHGTVFLHFPTMEELTAAVIERFGKRVSQRLHELASAGHGLSGVLEAHIKGLREHETFYTRLITERSLLPESAKTAFLSIQSSISLHISEAAERAMREGLIKQIPMHLLFNTWIGLVHYYLENGDLFAPGSSVLERRGGELIDHFMRLVSKKDEF
ncbi:MAG: TetR/AcrR family transcriptional regulator [Burkholderiales bacterium]